MYCINEVLEFLQSVDQDFPIPLSIKTSLVSLAQKYINYATLCCASSENRIVAMVAGYTENTPGRIGYISLVATRKETRRQGFSSALIRDFLRISRNKGLSAVHVYTHADNLSAIAMYEKLGFVRYYPDDEQRSNDIHFILYLE